jgi:S-adenosyl-L-methionine hydrolase (adenosine-forming)
MDTSAGAGYGHVRMSLPVSFLSDFGTEDEFVGVVHGVLAKLSPASRVIDVTHGIPRGNVMAGALSMTRAIQYLPEGVALLVVDPGVGTNRKALALETPWGFFVGPDNGVLSPAVALAGGATKIVSIENPEAMIPSPGATFHGRDIFAPAAGLLASGEATVEDLGPLLTGDDVSPLLLPLPEVEDGVVKGKFWWIDHFGNAQTNVGPDELAALGLGPGEQVSVSVGASKRTVKWVTSYGEVEEGEPLLHVDSAGLMAVAINGGNAAQQLRLAADIAVLMRPVSDVEDDE